MDITVVDDLGKDVEQIKNISRTIKVPDDITRTVKTVLESDEFNFFNTKSIHTIKRSLKSTEIQIAKLIKLRVASIEVDKRLSARYKKLVIDNNELKTKLKMKVQ
jgi:uncharacterized Zn finger protein